MTDFITGVFPFAAIVLCLIGTGWRFVRWMSLPPHVKWTLYPKPEGLVGQLGYMFREMFTFETLYKFNRPLWAGSFVMHMAMLGFAVSFILATVQAVSIFPARLFLYVIFVSALFIMGLRLTDRDMKALTSFEELFNLGFLAAAAISLWAALDVGFIQYITELAKFSKPSGPLACRQVLAVLLGGLFLIYLPWSKMVHYISKYFTYHEINWREQ